MSTSFALLQSDHPLVRRLVAVLGWLSLFATLALMTPGVFATANAEPGADQTGPSCEVAERADEGVALKLSHMMERLRAEAEQAGDSSDEVVVLNNSGFSYSPVRVPDRQADPER